MASQLLISVTKQDIQQGVKHSETSCAIARAVSRATGAKAAVNSSRIKVVKNGMTKRMPTTAKLAEFVRNFDAGRACEPFDFWMDE